jgi:CheY-like chemotaxis protein
VVRRRELDLFSKCMECGISQTNHVWNAIVRYIRRLVVFQSLPRHPEFSCVLAKSILVVDNSDMVRASLRKFLEREMGFKVCGEASDGLDALEKVPQLEPDLVILDLGMPPMNGLQAARKLRTLPVNIPSSCLRCIRMRCSSATLKMPALMP